MVYKILNGLIVCEDVLSLLSLRVGRYGLRYQPLLSISYHRHRTHYGLNLGVSRLSCLVYIYSDVIEVSLSILLRRKLLISFNCIIDLLSYRRLYNLLFMYCKWFIVNKLTIVILSIRQKRSDHR